MKRRGSMMTAALSALALLAGLATPVHALAQARLRMFSGGANQRPDLMRKLFDDYQKANPGVSIDTETGGATSELQRQTLSTVLNAKDYGQVSDVIRTTASVFLARTKTPAEGVAAWLWAWPRTAASIQACR